MKNSSPTPISQAPLRGPARFQNGTTEMAKQAALELLEYCRQNNWAGIDPYDGLESPFLKGLTILQSRPARIALIQFMKRSAVNIRPLLGIVHDHNPKALAVFSSALIRLLDAGVTREPALVRMLLKRLIDKRSPGHPYACWGYNFDWQNRSNLIPKFTPNVICTSFAGNALLDGYKKIGDRSYLETARSAGDFIMKGLNITRGDKTICFSYTPLDTSKVHNANFLAATFLARLFSITGEQELLDLSYRAVRYSAQGQQPDGSWAYGEFQTQQWIDNFHTGYNLMALRDFQRYSGIGEFEGAVAKGFRFYRDHFFEEGCLAKYYHNRLYPIDIHSIAQSIITLVGLKELDPTNMDLARAVCRWAIENMRHKSGFFYYQKKRFYTNRIPYMRWSQAWMLLALATLLHSVQATDACAAGIRKPANGRDRLRAGVRGQEKRREHQ